MAEGFDALVARSHVLVTGGSSGIGLALAGALARLGGHVHVAARRRPELDAATAALRPLARAGRTVTAHECDVGSAESVAKLFEELRARGAEPSVVVNSAGVTVPGYFTATSADDFDRIMRVNYMGTVLVAAQAVPGMIARREGWLLNVGSLASLIGVYGMSAYCASKFAVRGLTESLRSELKPHGIAVSLLCPPDTDTPMLAAERPLRPYETEALSASAGVLSAEAVADAAIRGMRRREAVIVPGLEAKATALAQRLVPGVAEGVADFIVRKARRAAELTKG